VTAQVMVRSANVYGWECSSELSPVTRWRIGSGGAAGDTGTPGPPVFGIATRQDGDVGLMGVAFESLENTRTISSGTWTLYYWNELVYASPHVLGANAGTEDTAIVLAQPGSIQPGDVIQIDSEMLVVQEVENGGLRLSVARAFDGSAAASHTAPATVYRLSKVVLVVPFARDFFGSPASGDFSYIVLLPDARIAAAELFVTNALGNSCTTKLCYTALADGGLRTLSGGQYSIQVEGHLAIQTNVAPPLVVKTTHAVGAVFARVNDAPTNAPGGEPVEAVEMDVRLDGTVYCHLTIPAGRTYSDAVSGCGLPPLLAGKLITLDITGVPQAAGSTPGRDLTVTIQL
jgi:hypothetical protein